MGHVAEKMACLQGRYKGGKQGDEKHGSDKGGGKRWDKGWSDWSEVTACRGQPPVSVKLDRVSDELPEDADLASNVRMCLANQNGQSTI